LDSEVLNHHLSRIETHWTAVFQAHQGRPAEVAEAQSALMRRYGGAVHRYLLASLRDPEAADDLSQEFALRFLRGDFRNADPGKGRFRDFLKRSIYHLMIDYHRGRRARPQLLDGDAVEPAATDADPWDRDLDQQFLDSWREQLMAHAWTDLDKVQERSGQPFADVLRLRVANPDLHSPQLAERLSGGLGRSVNAGWVRLNLHRAREMFVESLLGEVERSLGTPSLERLEEELSDLGLLGHCRSGLQRRGRRPPT
jgi:RNA polymerase sigma factor (sigma-70 family)